MSWAAPLEVKGVGNNVAQASQDITLSTSPAAGDILVVLWEAKCNAGAISSATIGDNKGGNTWTQAVFHGDATNRAAAIWQTTVVNGGASFTVTVTPDVSSQNNIIVHRYASPGTVSLENAVGNHSIASAPISAGTVTVATGPDLVVCCAGNPGSDMNTAGSGLALDLDVGTGFDYFSSESTITATSNTACAWPNTTTTWVCVAASYSFSASAPPSTATLSGATSGYVGTPVTYTITLDQPAQAGGVSCPVASTQGWTVTSSPVVIAENDTTGTFTVTPTTVATASVSLSATTPSLSLAGTPISLAATLHPPTTATLSGPTKGHTSTVSQPFTITLDYPVVSGTVSCPISSSVGGDTISTSPVIFNVGESVGTFTVTPTSSTGSRNITLGTTTPSLSIADSPIAYDAETSFAYTSTKSGNWNDATVWGGGVPISGDTATIAAGHTVTIPNSYAATIGATGQATGYTALSIADTGRLVIGGGTSGQLNLQGDIAITNQTSVGTVLTMAAGSTLKFVPSNAQQIKVGAAINAMIAINGSSAHRCAVLTDATALSGGGLTGYIFSELDTYASGASIISYCDFTDLSGGTTNGAVSCSCSTGQAISWTYCTFTRCERALATMTDGSQSYTVAHNTWISSIDTYNLRVSAVADLTSGTRLIDSNYFDKYVGLVDGRDVTITNNVFAYNGTNLEGTGTGGKKWAACTGNLFYGASGDDTPQLVARGDVTSNYFCNTRIGVSGTVFSLSVTNNTNSLIHGNIFETPVGSGSSTFMAFSVGGSTYVHTIQFNLTLPAHNSPATNGPSLALLNGWSGAGYTPEFYHNTTCCGTGEPAITYDESSGHTGWILAYKGNLDWNSIGTSQSAYHMMDTVAPASGGLIDTVATANADYNGSWNLFRSEPGDGQAGSLTGSGTVRTIAGCANNGGGLIRVTTTTPHGLSNGTTIYVEGVTGTTEANNTAATKWTISNASGSILDLNSSTFANAYTGGGRLCTTYPFAGNGYQSHFSAGFAGANDVSDGNPFFVDSTRNLGTWYTASTGANQTTTGTYLGDVAAAVAYIAGNPATDSASQIATRIAACINWVKAGFRPTRAALTGVTGTLDTAQSYTTDAAGNALAGTVGAMAFLSAAPTTATLTGPTSGALNTMSTAFTVTLDKPAGVGGVVVAVTSTEYNDTFS